MRGRLSGSIKIAIVSPAVADTSLLRLGEIMNLIVRRHPMLSIEAHNRNSRRVVPAIGSGEFDAGIALGTGIYRECAEFFGTPTTQSGPRLSRETHLSHS